MHTSGQGVLRSSEVSYALGWEVEFRILEVFKDALYKGKLLSAEEGVTILLAKTALPTKWGATCPITLSSAEAVELMLLMRRVARLAIDWGIKTYICGLIWRKLSIRSDNSAWVNLSWTRWR